MIIPVDALFRAQRSAWTLRMYCEECGLFDDVLVECAHGYPIAAHRKPDDMEADESISFCKDFDAM